MPVAIPAIDMHMSVKCIVHSQQSRGKSCSLFTIYQYKFSMARKSIKCRKIHLKNVFKPMLSHRCTREMSKSFRGFRKNFAYKHLERNH